MPGVAKRKYVGETMRYNKSIKRPLHLISEILPIEYNGKILLEYFKKYYPYEWTTLVQMQKQYTEKDKFLKDVGKKLRYKPLSPEDYFFSLHLVENILSNTKKAKHKEEYNREEVSKKKIEFDIKRSSCINKLNNRIEQNTLLIQNIDPLYVDYYICLYHKKGVTTEQKVEIIKDLSKYNSNKINTYFYKLNESEQNNQVRQMVFKYLQDRGLYVKFRKNFKGKKKQYQIEECKFNISPEDLLLRLKKGQAQSQKQYDIFISHSFSNQKDIIRLYKHLNKQGFSCYCDWTSDADFLKRSKVSTYTEEVLKYRIRQSKLVLYIDSVKAKGSRWVNLELDFARKNGKTIETIDILDVTNNLEKIDLTNSKI